MWGALCSHGYTERHSHSLLWSEKSAHIYTARFIKGNDGVGGSTRFAFPSAPEEGASWKYRGRSWEESWKSWQQRLPPRTACAPYEQSGAQSPRQKSCWAWAASACPREALNCLPSFSGDAWLLLERGGPYSTLSCPKKSFSMGLGFFLFIKVQG